MALNFSIQSDPVIVRKENDQEGPPSVPYQPYTGQPTSVPAAHHGGSMQFHDFPPQPHQNNFSYGYNQGEPEPGHITIPASALEAPPNSWLIFSIFTCLCCCWPIGIAAIVYSVRSNDQKALRNYQRSRLYASTALKLNIAAVVIGTIILVAVIVTTTLRFVNAANTYTDYDKHYSG